MLKIQHSGPGKGNIRWDRHDLPPRVLANLILQMEEVTLLAKKQLAEMLANDVG